MKKIRKYALILLGTIFTIFLGMFIEFYFGSFVKSVDIFFRGESKIYMNITELRSIESLDHINLDSFRFIFRTASGWGQLFIADPGKDEINKELGFFTLPGDMLFFSKNTVIYMFDMANTGSKSADIKLTINSGNKIEPPNDNRVIVDCGGFINKFCNLEIKDLQKGEHLTFAVTTDNSGLYNINCFMGENKCFENYRNYYLYNAQYFPSFTFKGEKKDFPSISKEKEFINYYFSTERKWEIMESLDK